MTTTNSAERALMAAIAARHPTRNFQLNPVHDADRERWMPSVRAVLALTESRSEGLEREAMTPEEIRLEHLKQIAAYAGPVVSFGVRDPYYLASCDHCGWVGSTELCGTDSYGDDSDVYCPRCFTGGADCGKVAAALAPRPQTDEPASGRVERVAEAIYVSAVGLDSDPERRLWVKCEEGTKDNFRRHARHALAALRPKPAEPAEVGGVGASTPSVPQDERGISDVR